MRALGNRFKIIVAILALFVLLVIICIAFII